MKPAQIANFLGHIGHPSDGTATVRQISPFRPRSLHNPQNEPPPPKPAFERGVRIAGAVRPRIAEPAEPPAPETAAKVEKVVERLADAYARGLADGRAEASTEAAEQRFAESAAAGERAAAERVAFQLNEYAKLQAGLRAGFAGMADAVEASVARILTPFLGEAAVRRAAEELRSNVVRLCAGGGPRMIRIRGPERVLRRLSEGLADLPVEVEYTEDENVEAVIEAGVTQIVAELRPWAELLASLDV
jgi:hypothetical protein